MSNPEKAFEDIGYKTEYRPESAEAIQKAFGKRAPSEVDFSAPRDEDGKFAVDKIEPGMYLPGWGPVLGQKPDGSDPAYDNIVEYPAKIHPKARPYFAAQEFARRFNKGNLEKVEEWVSHARRNKWAKDPSKKQ